MAGWHCFVGGCAVFESGTRGGADHPGVVGTAGSREHEHNSGCDSGGLNPSDIIASGANSAGIHSGRANRNYYRHFRR